MQQKNKAKQKPGISDVAKIFFAGKFASFNMPTRLIVFVLYALVLKQYV